MHADLERLIRLQRLDDDDARARSTIAALPERLADLEARQAAREQELAAGRARLEDGQKLRRELEKELAAVQTRLTRYKDQIMEVKTNKEYQAMQHEIAAAERDVRAIEDRILDRMEEAETLGAEVRAAEAVAKAEASAGAEERRALEAECRTLESGLEETGRLRARLLADTGADALALFEHVSRMRKGTAVVEARDGHCGECHVRLRPQHYNEVRRNDSLTQCESCHRILYFAGPSAATQAGA